MVRSLEIERCIDRALIPLGSLLIAFEVVLNDSIDSIRAVEGVHHEAVLHRVRQCTHAAVVVVVLLV